MMDESEKKKINTLAARVLRLSHDDLLMHLRFFDRAIEQVKLKERWGMNCLATDGQTLYYDPVYVLKTYGQNEKLVTRAYLHVLLHCIFSHSFQYERLDTDLWDLATDIAVENVIQQLQLAGVALDSDADRQRKLRVLEEDAGALTAERIYRYFRLNPPSEREKNEYQELFTRDIHSLWRPAEQIEMTVEQWKKISERIKADLKSFTKGKAGAETLEKNLEETTKDRYDYSDIQIGRASCRERV